jgi:hypothetical protein
MVANKKIKLKMLEEFMRERGIRLEKHKSKHA